MLYRRTRSLLFQCCFKLADGKWHRFLTHKAILENAIAAACDMYDEAQYRQKLDLAYRTHIFAQIAVIPLNDLRKQIDVSKGKTAYLSYVSCIEKYLITYFSERKFEELTNTGIVEFELLRDRQMTRKPKSSSLNNFTSAWNRVIATAVERGYLSERVPVPKLTTKGEKGKTRPAFSNEEVDREIRTLLRDYIEILLRTGMRHGTEVTPNYGGGMPALPHAIINDGQLTC